ncbi:MAG: phosphoenolpyruvate synthase, partial [Clostridia bacterium]|nr:phosphoenolpyruvate synthase [Clostridia bacterium]
LQMLKEQAKVKLPENVPAEHLVLESKGASMGLSRVVHLDTIVYVDPIASYNMPYAEKQAVSQLIGKVNWHYRDRDKHMMLFVPGRIGTSSPELGVPVTFSDISTFEVICEMEETKAGYNPELSYGSHIFQDLVEAEILYTAVFDTGATAAWDPERIAAGTDIAGEFDEEGKLSGIVHVYDMTACDSTLYYDLEQEHLILTV